MPSDLSSGQITSILGLNTAYEFSPELTRGTAADGASTAAAQGERPNDDGLTACQGAATEAANGYYTLDQEGSDYGIGSLLAAGESGSGVTVGLFELGQSSASDIATYQSCFGLTDGFGVVPVDGGAAADPGDTEEADLDASRP